MTTTNGVPIKVEQGRIPEALQEAVDKLQDAAAVTLDFASVTRIDPGALQAMEKLAGTADEKGAKVVLRGTEVDVYKVLKLARLSNRFSFVA